MKNLLLSVVLLFLFAGLTASVFWTNKWDYQLFNLSLDGVCPTIQKENASEYKGFIKRVCEKKTVEEFALEEAKAMEDAFQRTLLWELPFTSMTIKIDKMGSGKVEDTFWQKRVTKTKTAGETIESMHENYFTVDDGFVYDTGKDRYYDLQPSGYNQLRIVTDVEFKELSTPKETRVSVKEAGVTTIATSSTYVYANKIWFSSWKAIKNESFHVFTNQDISKKINWLSDGYTIVCYVPIADTTSYLEINQPAHSAGSEANMCDYISEMGIQGVTVSK